MTFTFYIFRKNKGTFRCDMTMIRGVMEVLSFFALLAIVPLAFLELFSNYAWICFTGDVYCGTDVPKNRLQNDRNFILIGFFICAAILGLYNKMVKTPLKAKELKDRAKDRAKDFKGRVKRFKDRVKCEDIKKHCCCCQCN